MYISLKCAAELNAAAGEGIEKLTADDFFGHHYYLIPI